MISVVFADPSWRVAKLSSLSLVFFFLFVHYSRATYRDHGEIMYSPFPVRCPRSGGTLRAPLPSAQACPEKT